MKVRNELFEIVRRLLIIGLEIDDESIASDDEVDEVEEEQNGSVDMDESDEPTLPPQEDDREKADALKQQIGKFRRRSPTDHSLCSFFSTLGFISRIENQTSTSNDRL